LNKGFVYVLRCEDQKLYTGSTRDLDKRLEAHRMGRVRTTKNRRPVELIYTEEFEDYKEARQRELYLKSGTGREWLQAKLEGWPSGCSPRANPPGRKGDCLALSSTNLRK